MPYRQHDDVDVDDDGSADEAIAGLGRVGDHDEIIWRALEEDVAGRDAGAVRESSVSSIPGANCHHTTRRAPELPYLARQLSEIEIWTVHRGVNPGGLFVRKKGLEAKSTMVVRGTRNTT